MEKKTLNHFIDAIKSCNSNEPWSSSLRLHEDSKISVYYSPFEHINNRAKIVICGITPGKTQAMEANRIARNHLIAGDSIEVASNSAKKVASFKGFRKPLSAMMDEIGLNKRLGLDSCIELFEAKSELVHYTSAIRYPTVLANGNNYNGTPRVTSSPFLLNMLDTYLAEEIQELGSDCLWLPLGVAASQACEYMVKQGVLQSSQLLLGLPHPSGANSERVAYFLGNKKRDKLSNKVDPDKLDVAKQLLMKKVANL
ncbi:hypothetical protein [Vibrio rarus]|uniref:hypothetical protein n=1 Tax=Vibrio rarus TaxID=413403 RepID=UPI0021C494A0|nr:hypothetical protein [Vibrio rarus]